MKIAGKLVDDTDQVSDKTKLLGVKREQTPIIKITERTKSSNFSYFYACDFATSYTSDVTKGANQSPSLNGFIGINFISIQKAQRKLRQITSYIRTVVKNAALQHSDRSKRRTT